MSSKIETGTVAVYGNEIVRVVSISHGWVTANTTNDEQVKMRKSALTPFNSIDEARDFLAAEDMVEELDEIDEVDEVDEIEGEDEEEGEGASPKLRFQHLDEWYTGDVEDAPKTASGKKVIDMGDGIAEQMRTLTLDEQYSFVAEFMGVDESELRAKYGHLNKGMQRMNLGNRARGYAKRVQAQIDADLGDEAASDEEE